MKPTVLLFAYDPRNHWMIREWVPKRRGFRVGEW
jgi:hypothetical protein